MEPEPELEPEAEADKNGPGTFCTGDILQWNIYTNFGIDGGC